jgi:hypothetical protein
MILGFVERANRTIVPGQMLAAFGLPAEERLWRPFSQLPGRRGSAEQRGCVTCPLPLTDEPALRRNRNMILLAMPRSREAIAQPA